MSRYFVAVRPPESVMDEIAGLPRPDVKGVRWTRRDQWHVTLAFLGDRSSAQRERLREAFDRTDRSGWPGAFALRLDRLQQWRHNGIVVAEPSGPCESLDRLAGLVSELSRSCGINLPQRPFVPHLTLLRRCRGVLPTGTVQIGPWQLAVNAFRLVESALSPAGASYQVIAEWGLPRSPQANGGQ